MHVIRARIAPQPLKPLPALLGLALIPLDHCQPSGHSLPLVSFGAFLLLYPMGLSIPNFQKPKPIKFIVKMVASKETSTANVIGYCTEYIESLTNHNYMTLYKNSQVNHSSIVKVKR